MKLLSLFNKSKVRGKGKRKFKLICTNCGSEFKGEGASLVKKGICGNEYVCPVCEYYPVWATKSTVKDLSAFSDVEKSIRETVIQARADGLEISKIIALLKGELEFVAEIDTRGHYFLVQLIDLGSYKVSISVPEGRRVNYK